MIEITPSTVQQHILEQIESEHPKLLSEIGLTDQELEVIRERSGPLIAGALSGVTRYNLVVAYLMMDVGMRNYSDGDYWGSFWNEIKIRHTDKEQTELGKFFIDVLKKYNLAYKEGKHRKYVDNIMMHAFIPENQNYRDSFFNFVLKFYRIVLNGTTSDDLDDKLQIMADVFKGDSIGNYPELNGIPLIVSTREALSDVDYFGNTVKKIIHRFAEDYESLEDVDLGRYERSFREWVNALQHSKQKRRSIGERPFVHFDVSDSSFRLIIPSMEVSRPNGIILKVESSSGDVLYSGSIPASMQFDRAITDDHWIMMKWNPLDEYRVLVDGCTVYENRNSELMILNKNGNQRRKVAIGFNMIVVPKNADINLQTSVILEMKTYEVRAFMISRGEVLTVGDNSYIVEEEVSANVHIVSACLDVGCLDQDGNKYDVYSSLPKIRISSDERMRRFRLTVSHALNSVLYESYDKLIQDPEVMLEGDDAVLDLSETTLRSEAGIYRIRLNGREMYRFVLMPDFAYEFEKQFYEEDECSTVRYTGNEAGVAFNTRDGVVSLDPMIMDGRELHLVLQIPSRRFSFDKKTWHMFGEEMYYRDTQSERIYIYCPTLVYPVIDVNYEGSKPINLEIEGRLLVCEMKKINQIGVMIEYSRQLIFKLKFKCGRFDIFIIRYTADYTFPENRIVRRNAPPNTWAVVRDDSTKSEYRIEDDFEIPEEVGDYTLLEYHEGDFGDDYRVVRNVSRFLSIPEDTSRLIMAGDPFVSILNRRYSKEYAWSDFRNLVEIDKPYDPMVQNEIRLKYQNAGEFEEKSYLMVEEAVRRAILADRNTIRLNARIWKFRDVDPAFCIELCNAYLTLDNSSEVREILSQLQ